MPSDVPTFSDGLPLWCSLASRSLGWRPDEFWRATPAELAWALRDPETAMLGAAAPSREMITKMLERDENE